MVVIRSILFNLYLYGLTAGMAVLCMPSFLLPRFVLVRLMEFWARRVRWGLSAIAGIEVEFRGRHHLTRELIEGGVLVASKHQSMLDTIMVHLMLDDPAIVLKRELTYIPLYGWYCRKARMLIVDRGAAAKAMRRLLADARERIEERRPLFIYPEGTRTAPDKKVDYKPGVAGLYTQLRLSCLPVALNSGLVWGRNDWRKRPGKVVIEMLEPIPPGLDRRRFMAELEGRIEPATARLLDLGIRSETQAA